MVSMPPRGGEIVWMILFPCREKRKIIQIKMAIKRIFESFT
jgi:hypothetical protein